MKRIYHTWEKWECYPAGFYEDHCPGDISNDRGEELYQEFLSDLPAFEKALNGVITEWKHSCEHYLTNQSMNRIAWLGQAAMAYAHRIPACCRGGYNKLSEDQRDAADKLAFKYLSKWIKANGGEEMTWEEAQSKTKADLY